MGKLAPTEVDRRAMSLIRAMHAKALARDRLRGFVQATDDDLRLRAILEAVESDDSAVLEAWEEFVWRVAIARRTRERDARQREEREEHARRRREAGERARQRPEAEDERIRDNVAERDRRRLDEGWAAWDDWAPPHAAPDEAEEAEGPTTEGIGGAAEGDRAPGVNHGGEAGEGEDGDPWTTLGLDSLAFWHPWREPGRSTPPPRGEPSYTSTSRIAAGIQREPTPAPGRWSPPLPVERRPRRRLDPEDPTGPMFVFDEPPERLHPAEDRPIRVIDLARRSREIADTAAQIRAQRAERAERAERERASSSSSSSLQGLGLRMGTSSSRGLHDTGRRSPSPPSASQSWLEEWSASQPLLGRRVRDDDEPYTLRRVRRRISSRDPRAGDRDTRRDGIVFPNDVDVARMLESAGADADASGASDLQPSARLGRLGADAGRASGERLESILMPSGSGARAGRAGREGGATGDSEEGRVGREPSRTTEGSSDAPAPTTASTLTSSATTTEGISAPTRRIVPLPRSRPNSTMSVHDDFVQL